MSPAYETEARDDHGRWTSGGEGRGGGRGGGGGRAEGAEADRIAAASYRELDPYYHESVDGYVEGSMFMNEYLRGRFPEMENGGSQGGPGGAEGARMDEQAATMDEAIESQAPLQQDITLHRGTDHYESYSSLEPGEKFRDSAFLSTSTNKAIAEDFGMNFGGNGMLEVQVDAGTKVMHIPTAIEGRGVGEGQIIPVNEGEATDFTTQREVVLPRGSEYEVVEHRDVVPGEAPVTVVRHLGP